MAYPIWITNSGNLGLVPENEYFEVALDAYNPGGGNLTYSFLAGEMPPGIHVTKAGTIQGVPIVTDASNLNRSYEFSVRVKNAENKIADRTFTITVTNIIPPQITPDINYLGDVFDGTFYSLQLQAFEVNPQATLTWSLENGQLPNGLTLSSSGLISGLIKPLVNTVAGDTGFSNTHYGAFGYDNAASYKNNTYTFTVRVYDGANYDSQTYVLNVTAKGGWTADSTVDIANDTYLTIDHDNRYLPIVITPPQSLPEIRSGSNFAFKVDAVDPNQDNIKYALNVSGAISFDAAATGVNLYHTGTISSVISFDVPANTVLTDYVVDHTKYIFDITDMGVSTINNANVTIDSVYWVWNSNLGLRPLSSGEYAITTLSGPYVGTYNTNIVVTGSKISCSTAFVPTSAGRLKANVRIGFPTNPSVTQAPAAQFDGSGFDQSALGFGNSGLLLDENTGWLQGTIAAQSEAIKTYDIQIFAYKSDPAFMSGLTPLYKSDPVTYKVNVLGDITNTITWVTDSYLGDIQNGAISELSLSAISNAGKDLVFTIETDSRLPQGVKLVTDSLREKVGSGRLSSALLSGRASFEYFSLDNGTTTLDGVKTTLDNVYTFTVKAESTDKTVNSTKTFSVKVNNFNKSPYENLYLKALTSLDQRQTFLSIVNNKDIFPDNLIYRANDPWFGRAKDIRSLFLAGLDPTQINDYISAISTNHYNKRIEFSKIKTARALDANFNVKYEVVYIDLEDDKVNNGQTPANSITLRNKNYYNGNSAYNVVYTNSFKNMESAITGQLGYTNQGALPGWMTSTQENNKPLGFVRSIVLAYTQPNASKLIAYRLKSNGIEFNNIDFVADRYALDSHLSKNYDTVTNKFVTSVETTFDRINRIGKVLHTVDYALRDTTFESINGQTVEYIRNRGGFDGVKAFEAGQRLIFAQQEQYAYNTSPNDGWNLITESGTTTIPGYLDNILDSGIIGGTGFPTDPAHGELATVNGTTYVYTDNDGLWRIANQRAAIWEIQITNNIVTLVLAEAVLSNDKIQVNLGQSFSSGVVFYDVILKSTKSVPEYTSIVGSAGRMNTYFDGHGTKFIDKRDTYADPEINDKYLKFPQIGVFK